MKVKGASDGKKQTVVEGINKAGKSTAKRMAATRRHTPKPNGPSASRSRRPA